MKHLTSSRPRDFVKFTTAVAVLSFASINAAAAQDMMEYTGITQKMFTTCIKNDQGGGGWSEYAGGNSGEVNIKAGSRLTPLHIAHLRYRYIPSEMKLVYTLINQGLGGRGQLWGGFDATMKKCRG